MVSQALQLMLYGLAGVFSSLAVLSFSVKVMTLFFPDKDKGKKGED